MEINVVIGALEHEILTVALYSYKTEVLSYGNVPRSDAVQLLIDKLGI